MTDMAILAYRSLDDKRKHQKATTAFPHTLSLETGISRPIRLWWLCRPCCTSSGSRCSPHPRACSWGSHTCCLHLPGWRCTRWRRRRRFPHCSCRCVRTSLQREHQKGRACGENKCIRPPNSTRGERGRRKEALQSIRLVCSQPHRLNSELQKDARA